MGFLPLKIKNPFQFRQPGAGQASTNLRVNGRKRSERAMNKIVADVQAILRQHPMTTDAELYRVLLLDPNNNNDQAIVETGRAAYGKEKLLTTAVTPANIAPATTGDTVPRQQSGGELNLVNYTPEQLVDHVNQSMNRVQFGWSWNIRAMENYSELWAFAGPVVLLLGTIGEIFLVLWSRQKEPSVVAGLSIVAVAMVLEGTFLAVSYKAATIRNRAERRPDGPTDLDRRKLRRQFAFWAALACGVCVTQIIFILAQTKDDGSGAWLIWLIAILRSIFTLVADGYTAFAHEEKPTTAERALEEEEQRAKHAKMALTQKKEEIRIINDGILQVREVHTEAQIKDVKLRTRLEVERLQSASEVESLRAQQEQATMFAKLSTGIVRALFDPEMPDEQRMQLLSTMQGFMGAAKLLPQGHTKITPVEDD